MDLIIAAINYVTSDDHFWASMALTTMTSMFIGSVIYDGELKEIKKGMLAVGAYAGLIVVTNAWRIIPRIGNISPSNAHMPLAGVTTLAFVSIFYILGMIIGIAVTNIAHHGKHKGGENKHGHKNN